jgi:hypothetical protein
MMSQEQDAKDVPSDRQLMTLPSTRRPKSCHVNVDVACGDRPGADTQGLPGNRRPFL